MSYPCPPCCGERTLTCEACSFDAYPTQWSVDLGAGGLIDDQCDFCDQIQGQYSLGLTTGCLWAGAAPCQWEYSAIGVCDYLGLDLLITLAHVFTSPTWIWQVDVVLLSDASSCSQVEVRIVYATATPTEAEDCWHFGGQGSGDKITLTKVSEVIQSSVCTGNLPATIDIWVP